MGVQVRSEETGIRNFPTVKEAMDYALNDKSVWKISFDADTGEPVRLVSGDRPGQWIYEPVLEPLLPGQMMMDPLEEKEAEIQFWRNAWRQANSHRERMIEMVMRKVEGVPSGDGRDMETAFDILMDEFINTHFDPGTVGSGIVKIDEEVAEFKDNPTVDEASDVLICLMVELRQRGFGFYDLMVSTRQKAHLNLTRTWERREDGTIHHT